MISSRRIPWLVPLLALSCCFLSCGKSNWNEYSSKEFGISINSPYPVKFKTEETKVKGETTSRVLNGDAESSIPKIIDIASYVIQHLTAKKPRLLFFNMSITSMRMNNPESVFDSKRLLTSFLEFYVKSEKEKKFANVKHQEHLMECSGLPAIHTVGSFEVAGVKTADATIYFHNLIVTHKNTYWQVYMNYANGDKYDEIADKIIESVRIKP